MAQLLSFQPLGSAHAAQVDALARALGRSAAAPGAALREAERGGSNRSLGLWDGRRLAGYAIAQARGAGLRGAPGAVVQVLQLGLRPAYRWALAEFLARCADRLAHGGPPLPLEALGSARDLQLWSALERAELCEALGYRLAAQRALDDSLGEPCGWLRWEPLAPAADPRELPVAETHQIGELAIDVRIARSELEWARLEPLWNALLEASPGATGYQSFEYLRAWWRCFGASRRLWIATFWSGATLLGAAPLCVSARAGAFGRARELGFLGCAVGGAPSFVDRPVFLFGRHGEPCLQALLRTLEGAVHWDVLALHEQAPDAPATRALLELARTRGWPYGTKNDAPSAYAHTQGSYEAFMAARSRQFRRLLRVSERRLEEAGRVHCERHSGELAVRAALARYCELERASWKQGTPAAVGASPRREFYAELAAALAAKGELQLSFLMVDERPVAGALALLHGASMHVLEVVYDQEFARCSPGTVLQALDFEYAFARGCREVDLRAGQLAHKQNWSSGLRETQGLWLARPSASRWLEWAWRMHLAPVLKRGVRRLRALAGVAQ